MLTRQTVSSRWSWHRLWRHRHRCAVPAADDPALDLDGQMDRVLHHQCRLRMVLEVAALRPLPHRLPRGLCHLATEPGPPGLASTVPGWTALVGAVPSWASGAQSSDRPCPQTCIPPECKYGCDAHRACTVCNPCNPRRRVQHEGTCRYLPHDCGRDRPCDDSIGSQDKHTTVVCPWAGVPVPPMGRRVLFLSRGTLLPSYSWPVPS